MEISEITSIVGRLLIYVVFFGMLIMAIIANYLRLKSKSIPKTQRKERRPAEGDTPAEKLF